MRDERAKRKNSGQEQSGGGRRRRLLDRGGLMAVSCLTRVARWDYQINKRDYGSQTG